MLGFLANFLDSRFFKHLQREHATLTNDALTTTYSRHIQKRLLVAPVIGILMGLIITASPCSFSTSTGQHFSTTTFPKFEQSSSDSSSAPLTSLILRIRKAQVQDRNEGNPPPPRPTPGSV